MCVPSGNFGNICAALFGHEMGLPIKRFIAANNANSVFYDYLRTGVYTPRPSIQTIANAMDVGDPSNFARVIELYGHDWKAITDDISGNICSDDQIRQTLKYCREKYGYQLDPHGACGFHAVYHNLGPGESALLCETAHPAKFKDTVEAATGAEIEIPARLAAFMQGTKQSVPMGRDYASFKDYLSKIQ